MLLWERYNEMKTKDRPLDLARISDLEDCIFRGIEEQKPD